MTYHNFTLSLLPGAIHANKTLSHGSNNVATSPLCVLVNLFLAMFGVKGSTRNNLEPHIWDSGVQYKIEKVKKVVNNVTMHEETVKKIIKMPKHDDLVRESALWIDSAIKQKHFTIHHSIYIQEGVQLHNKFQDTVRKNFKSLRPKYNFVNFEKGDLKKIAGDMNAAVEKMTDGVVTQIVDEKTFSKDDRGVLVSVAYFTDPWKEPFDSLITMRGSPFYLMGEKREKWVPVSMMQIRGDSRKKFNYGDDVFGVGAQAIRLEYQNDASLILILPESNSKKSIEKVMDQMRVQGKNFIPNLLKELSPTPLRFVQVPRTIIESNMELNKAFLNLGIHHIFNPKADFSEMVSKKHKNENFRLNKVIHKVIVPLMDERIEEYDDSGASSITQLVVPSASSKRVTFNSPFFAFIIGKDNKILFSSLVMQPDNV